MSNGRYVANAADILFGSFVRYERLDQLMSQFDKGTISRKSINIVIDIESLTRRLVINSNEVVIDDPYLIASCIINLAIHLRGYFVTRYKTNPTIYLVYSTFNETPSNIVQGGFIYNSSNTDGYRNNQYMTNLIHENLRIIDILVKYLERIYFIQANDEFVVAAEEIKTLPKKNKEDTLSTNLLWIVYSKDPMAYQSVSYSDSTIMIRPKKSRNEDTSYIIYKSQLYTIYRLYELGNTNFYKDYNIPITLFDLFLAMNGVRSRNLMALYNSTSSLKRIQLAIENKELSAIATITQMEYCKSLGDDLNEIINRLKLISARYLISNAMRRYDWSVRYWDKVVDLDSPHEIQEINNKYFQKYPIDLNRV